MRTPFFRKLNLEELERLVLPNLFFGQVGTPAASIPLDDPRLDGLSVVDSNAITRNGLRVWE